MIVGSGACVARKSRIDGFLMAYFGGAAESLRALLLVKVEVEDEEESIKMLWTIRSLIRALRPANCGMSIFDVV